MREIKRSSQPTHEIDGGDYLKRLDDDTWLSLWHKICQDEFGEQENYCDGDFKITPYMWKSEGYGTDKYAYIRNLTDEQLRLLSTEGDIDCPDDDPRLVEYEKLNEEMVPHYGMDAGAYAAFELVRRMIIKDYPEAEEKMKKGQLALAFYQ